MSRVGVSTACYYPQDTFLSFREVINIGVPVAEVFMNSLEELDRSNLLRYKAEIKARDIEIISFHPYTSAFESLLFFSEYSLRLKDGIELYKRLKKSIVSTTVCDSKDVIEKTDDRNGDKLRFVETTYFVNTDGEFTYSRMIVGLRKNADGEWKIIGVTLKEAEKDEK